MTKSSLAGPAAKTRWRAAEVKCGLCGFVQASSSRSAPPLWRRIPRADSEPLDVCPDCDRRGRKGR